jgi:hypothetical protein
MDIDLMPGHATIAASTPDQRRRAGAALRRAVPRSAQGHWTRPDDRADPVGILIEQGKSRIQELLPIRYGRMATDPFAFMRGAAAVMASSSHFASTTNCDGCPRCGRSVFRRGRPPG